MSQIIVSKCKKCQRAGVKLFLRGERCFSNKCKLEKKRPLGRMRRTGRGRSRRLSEYGQQLKEKQKLRWMYGLSEKQFERTYQKAERSSKVTGEEFLCLLERRLDNVVYRLGFSSSRAQARQLVAHGHFLVNSRKVDIPSYLVKEEDLIELRAKSKKLVLIRQNLSTNEKRSLLEWLELDKTSFKGKVKRLPRAEELDQEVNLSLIVEFYSR